MPATTVPDRYRATCERVAAAALAAGRDPADVRLLVATKTQPITLVREVIAAGARLIGENRVQELVAKAPGIADLTSADHVLVHLIGPLQRNKINPAVATAECIESIDSLRLAQAISHRLPEHRILDVMIQVNVSGEPTKHGVAPGDAPGLAAGIGLVPGLRLTGFMTIGARSDDPQLVGSGFARLRAIRDQVLASGSPGTATARELSMGMSADLDLAIAEGATIVRVGTAIFGARETL